MLVLEPIFHKTLWGGNRLSGIYGEQATGLGHLYSFRCKPHERSNMILNGKYAGQLLFDVIGAYPLSIALDDAASDLSIQVHPGGDAAKYESYFFIDAPAAGYIYCGIENMTTPEIRAAAKAGTIAELIRRTPIVRGDYVYIAPRTVHALTAGSFVYECEYGEDNTYRLYDYNRTDADGNRRALQLEHAIGVLDTSLKPVIRKYLPGTAIAEKTYETRLLAGITGYINRRSTIECLTLLSGSAIVDGVSLKTGMTVILEPGEMLERLAVERCIVARSLI
jgi:mannose-6-phosphate isomerase